MEYSGQKYKSILTICTGFLVLFYFFEYQWMFYVSISIGVLSLASSNMAAVLQKSWYFLGKGLGYVNSRILLTLIYILLVIPISYMYRLSKKRSIRLKKSNTSYWTERNHIYEKVDLKNVW